jgi:hypothetical protein
MALIIAVIEPARAFTLLQPQRTRSGPEDINREMLL